jgi:hypothetical protein
MGLAFFIIGLLFLAQQDALEPYAAPIPPPADDIRSVDGVVLDATTSAPIAGAHVTLRYQTSEAALQEISTGINGRFHFSLDQPGQFAIEASKDGYLAKTEKLPSDKSAPSVTLALETTIAIRGRVRDGEIGDGLSNFTVTALRVTYFRGNRELVDDRTAFTDEQGDFRLDQLQPGDYFIEIKKFPPGTILAGRQEEPSENPEKATFALPADNLARWRIRSRRHSLQRSSQRKRYRQRGSHENKAGPHSR